MTAVANRAATPRVAGSQIGSRKSGTKRTSTVPLTAANSSAPATPKPNPASAGRSLPHAVEQHGERQRRDRAEHAAGCRAQHAGERVGEAVRQRPADRVRRATTTAAAGRAGRTDPTTRRAARRRSPAPGADRDSAPAHQHHAQQRHRARQPQLAGAAAVARLLQRAPRVDDAGAVVVVDPRRVCLALRLGLARGAEQDLLDRVGLASRPRRPSARPRPPRAATPSTCP